VEQSDYGQYRPLATRLARGHQPYAATQPLNECSPPHALDPGFGRYGKGSNGPLGRDRNCHRNEIIRASGMSLVGQSRHFDRTPIASGLPQIADMLTSVGMFQRCYLQTFAGMHSAQIEAMAAALFQEVLCSGRRQVPGRN
jgi:hypothetical protein